MACCAGPDVRSLSLSRYCRQEAWEDRQTNEILKPPSLEDSCHTTLGTVDDVRGVNRRVCGVQGAAGREEGGASGRGSR